MLDWEVGDRFSFEDSDRFEEDSLCSWSTEPESVCNNWRGWRKPTPQTNTTCNNSFGLNGGGGGGNTFYGTSKRTPEGPSVAVQSSSSVAAPTAPQIVVSLTELAAKCVASFIPFEVVERFYPPVPEQLQLRIAFWSFPDNEEDIRLYSCLASGAADEFTRGENLHRNHMVKDPLQIGFHLSASVQQCPRGTHNVAVTFDRRRISSCNCTCSNPSAYWCSHVVAVCLTRIHWPHLVTLRAPVSESLSRLHREQLQKFAQYLISELPQQILPTAQRILDELLSAQPTAINSVCGAPDPTAGPSANDQTSWYLDSKALHDNIKKILIKFCVPAPIVFSDVNYLSTVAPPAAAEWTSLLRPLRGREPEGMWNLLSIVREMFKRTDRNAVPLLEIITEECLSCDQILLWWFNTKVALQCGTSSNYGGGGNSGGGGGGGGKHNNVNSNTHASQHACASLCDEVVVLWRLAALNPGLAPSERDILHNKFTTWHMKILEKVTKCRNTNTNTTNSSNNNNNNNNSNNRGGAASSKLDLEVFPGFKSAIEACYLDWDDYPMPGITYTNDVNPMYHCPFTCFRHGTENAPEVTSSSKALMMNCAHAQPQRQRHYHKRHQIERFNSCFPPSVMSLHPAEFPPLLGQSTPAHNATTNNGSGGGGGGGGGGNRSSVSSEGFCENDDLLPREQYSFDSDSQETTSTTSSSAKEMMTAAVTTTSNPSKPVTTTSTASSSSNSDSPPQSDDYNNVFPSHNNSNSAFFKCDDPWDVLFARAEGLHAHGHNREACILSVKLAEQLLDNPPDFMMELPPPPPLPATMMMMTPTTSSKRKGKKGTQINPASHHLTCLASATLAKCAFLCAVLADYTEHYHLAFRVGVFGLEMSRPPASTKPLEVKLSNQETDLVNLLKRIPLSHCELQILRVYAEQLKDGSLKARGDLLPIMLASFVFDALVVPYLVGKERCSRITMLRLPTDESLGFEAAVAALGLKANVSEADHPLLCEGTRRQRGDLAISLLTFYKDDCWKVARIMDRLLDREIHQLIKTPLVASYYSNNPPIIKNVNLRRDDCELFMAAPTDVVLSTTTTTTTTTTSTPNNNNSGDLSRPHSSTSAELEFAQALTNITASTPPGLQVTPSTSSGGVMKAKETPSGARYKGKRLYPSIPNQPSEAGAHFMFELAKVVLNKAGGTSSTSLFTQPSTTQNHHGPNKALHMCAFQLGLYALGLHNCVSPNWLSRTYSSHVSWITGQAMEIGAAAISFLIDTWEGHLTPPEAANIADRASRGCDLNMVRTAAQLALSCLPHAAALNPNEIQRAILQCKEQSDDMLEHACLTVEQAAKGGGVYPEVLFQVAKYWYELYVHQTPGGDQYFIENDEGPPPLLVPLCAAPLVEPMEQPQIVVATATPPPPPPPYYAAIPYPTHFLHHHHHYGGGGPLHPLQPMCPAPYMAPPPPPPPQLYYTPAPDHRQPFSQAQLRYLLTAYRVGMLALETLARRVHDDRPQAKYARNPPYGDDVKWLLMISRRLGTQYLHHYCVCVVNSIVSPFVLHDVAIEAAHYLSRHNPGLVMQHLRTSLTPLVQKCQQMYIQCMHQKLYHLTAADYEDFVSIVCVARAAFQITPEGSAQFKEWLQSIRRSKSCKKDLWAQINAALQANTK